MPLPIKKNYLRDILPKSGIGIQTVVNRPKDEDEVIYHKLAESVSEYQKDRGGKWRIWFIAGGAVLVLSVVLLYAFSSAEVTITPRVDEFQIDGDFSAGKDVATSSADGLSFSVQTVEKTSSQNVTADGQKEVDQKASGKITVYNNYSTNTQKLIVNTRFETSDGLIYRIDRSIIVPGYKVVDGKIVPGSVEATVFADSPGVKYNIGPTDFTIPGFKSDSKRYAGFYAHSDSPMINGYSGMANYLTDAKQKLVKLQIRSELEKEMLIDARASAGNDRFIPNNAYILEFESLPTSNSANGQVMVQEKAKMTIYSFKVSDLDNFLATKTPFYADMGSSTARITNRDSLDFAWLSRPNLDSSKIFFHLNGNAQFVWNIDETKIVRSLVGKKRGEIQNVLKQYNEVANATASISPFWQTGLPTDPSKITIIVKTEN